MLNVPRPDYEIYFSVSIWLSGDGYPSIYQSIYRLRVCDCSVLCVCLCEINISEPWAHRVAGHNYIFKNKRDMRSWLLFHIRH